MVPDVCATEAMSYSKAEVHVRYLPMHGTAHDKSAYVSEL